MGMICVQAWLCKEQVAMFSTSLQSFLLSSTLGVGDVTALIPGWWTFRMLPLLMLKMVTLRLKKEKKPFLLFSLALEMVALLSVFRPS